MSGPAKWSLPAAQGFEKGLQHLGSKHRPEDLDRQEVILAQRFPLPVLRHPPARHDQVQVDMMLQACPRYAALLRSRSRSTRIAGARLLHRGLDVGKEHLEEEFAVVQRRRRNRVAGAR